MSLLERPPADADPEELLADYREELGTALAEAERDRADAETDLAASELDAIEAGDLDGVSRIDLADAVDLLGLADRDAEALLAQARDELLMGMTAAVMDVDRLAARLAVDLDPKEIQAKVEGRHSMTLGEYAALRAALAR